MEHLLFWMIPVSSLLALLLAWYFYRQMMKESEGTPVMQKIASHVRQGAMSYLKQQYKIVGLVFLARLQPAKLVGTDSIPHRRILLRTFRLFGYENGDLRIGTYCQRCP